MLKQRVITAIILVTVLLAALLAKNPIFWRLTISVALFVAFWEWLRFCEISGLIKQLGCFVLFTVIFAALQIELIPLQLVVVLSCSLWLLLLLFTITDRLGLVQQPIVKLCIGLSVLSSAGYLLIQIKSITNGPLWILCFMVAVWAADIGAYFVGKRFGKTKLAPSISPGKTIEGLVGGLAFVLALFVPIFLWSFEIKQAALLLLVVVLTALISVGGDLFESKLKRYVGLKDSSQVLPGHGGVLDRIDSLLASAPFFVLGLLMLGFLS